MLKILINATPVCHRADEDLDRLYEFLTEASHSVKTADNALKAIEEDAIYRKQTHEKVTCKEYL